MLMQAYLVAAGRMHCLQLTHATCLPKPLALSSSLEHGCSYASDASISLRCRLMSNQKLARIPPRYRRRARPLHPGPPALRCGAAAAAHDDAHQ